jgi:hypothetical protein
VAWVLREDSTPRAFPKLRSFPNDLPDRHFSSTTNKDMQAVQLAQSNIIGSTGIFGILRRDRWTFFTCLP